MCLAGSCLGSDFHTSVFSHQVFSFSSDLRTLVQLVPVEKPIKSLKSAQNVIPVDSGSAGFLDLIVNWILRKQQIGVGSKYVLGSRSRSATLAMCILVIAALFPLMGKGQERIATPVSAGTGRSVRVVGGRVEYNLSDRIQKSIFVGLPKAIEDADGKLLVLPNAFELGALTGSESLPSADFTFRDATLFSSQGQLPSLMSPEDYSDSQLAQQTGEAPSLLQEPIEMLPRDEVGSRLILEPVFGRLATRRARAPIRWGRLFDKIFGCCTAPGGIGRERLAYALFSMDGAAPNSNYRIRINSDFTRIGMDRAGYYWAEAGTGPSYQDSIRVREFRFITETGSAGFSVTTDIPFREIVSDDLNTAGMGDMSVTTKTVLKDGDQIQMTQIFRSYFKTGSVKKGLGTGQLAFEPGIAIRFKIRPQTEFQTELLYYFQSPGVSPHSGQVLKWGLGAVHAWYDTDEFAIVPTIELTGWSILDGEQTGAPDDANGFPSAEGDIINLTSGCRFIIDKSSDLGLFDAGFAASLPVTRDRWYAGSLAFELRWSN